MTQARISGEKAFVFPDVQADNSDRPPHRARRAAGTWPAGPCGERFQPDPARARPQRRGCAARLCPSRRRDVLPLQHHQDFLSGGSAGRPGGGPADAFVLGTLHDAPRGTDRRFRQDRYIRTRAPTGAGKGIGVIPNLLDYPGSAFDPERGHRLPARAAASHVNRPERERFCAAKAPRSRCSSRTYPSAMPSIRAGKVVWPTRRSSFFGTADDGTARYLSACPANGPSALRRRDRRPRIRGSPSRTAPLPASGRKSRGATCSRPTKSCVLALPGRSCWSPVSRLSSSIASDIEPQAVIRPHNNEVRGHQEAAPLTRHATSRRLQSTF